MAQTKESRKKDITTRKLSKPKTSRGQKRFIVGKELREQARLYTEQAQAEAEKASKRRSSSAWGSLLGAIGAPLMAAAALTNPIGWAAAAALAGGGSLAGARAGYWGSKKVHGERKDIKVDKFYHEEAAQATEDIKELDRQTAKKAYKSAATSAVIAGVGTAAKAGKFGTGTKHGVNPSVADNPAGTGIFGGEVYEQKYADALETVMEAKPDLTAVEAMGAVPETFDKYGLFKDIAGKFGKLGGEAPSALGKEIVSGVGKTLALGIGKSYMPEKIDSNVYGNEYTRRRNPYSSNRYS